MMQKHIKVVAFGRVQKLKKKCIVIYGRPLNCYDEKKLKTKNASPVCKFYWVSS